MNVKRRMESRFTRNGELSAMLFMVSSKKSDHDFLEQYIQTIKDSPNVYLVDEPLWKVQPADRFAKETFRVAVGNKYIKSRILKDGESSDSITKQGFRIIDVPLNFKKTFEQDIDSALMDIAGISSTITSKFISYDSLKSNYIKSQNPFTSNVLSIGLYDDLEIKDFYKPELVNDDIISMPVFIHIDTSLTGDRTGISAVAIMGTKKAKRYDKGEIVESRELYYRQVFSIGIQCPANSEISLEKNRDFIYYLHSIGYNIKSVSLDGYQSRDTIQMLKIAGYECKLLSLDKTPDGYMSLKAALNEHRVGVLKIPELESEIINLERNNMTGKVDHPADGCLVSNTLIKTNHGDKRIIDLLPNDKVYSYDISNDSVIESEFINLRETKKVNKIYNIETEDGNIIECTNNHLILCSNNIYKRADDLTTNDSIVEIIDTSIKYSNNNNTKTWEFLNNNDNLVRYYYVYKKLSLSKVSSLINIPKTTLNCYTTYKGYKRTKSEAQKIALYRTNYKVKLNTPESAFKTWLDAHQITNKSQFIIEGFSHRFDFYIPDYNMMVEIDGIYWHRLSCYNDPEKYKDVIDIHNRDMEINKIAISNGFIMSRITDSDIKYKNNDELFRELLSGEFSVNNKIIISGDEIKYYKEIHDKKISQIKNRDLRKLRYGIPGYKGSKLSDHWKYKNYDLNEFIKYIGNDQSHTIFDLLNKYGSRNLIRRMVRESYKINNFDEFIARYLKLSNESWKVRKLKSDYIELGLVNNDSSIITPSKFLEFVSSNNNITKNDIYSFFGRGRNYTILWFKNILGVNFDEWISSKN